MTTHMRPLALAMACALILTFLMPALAESRTVYVSRSGAKIYSSSGASVSLPVNTKVSLTGVKGSVCRVSYGGHTGYMRRSDLSVKKAGSSKSEAPKKDGYSKTVYAAKDGARLYNASGVMVGSVAMNTRMTCTGIRNGVCRVTRDGRTAYMKKSELSGSPVVIPEVTPTPAPAAKSSAMSATVYASKNGAKVYSRSGSVIAKLDRNAQVTCTGVKGSVCRVTAGGKTGYMKKSDLSTTAVSAPSATAAPALRASTVTAYVNKPGARVYGASGRAVGRLALNTAVTVGAVRGSACLVRVDGRKGVMRKSDLSAAKTEVSAAVVDIADTTGYVNKSGAKVYDASGNVIATLPVNTAVTVSACSDALVQVVNGSMTGYMSRDDISAGKVSTVPSGYTLKRGDSGEAVKKVQRRLQELGYFAGVIGGNYQSLTVAAVKAFQTQARLSVTGVCNAATLEAMFSDDAPKMPQTAAYSAGTSAGGTSSNSTATPARGAAVAMDWWSSGIQKIFARGTTAVITDVATGLAWREQRRGGTNHADVQPLTAADTAVLKKAYGGKWSWDRRAVFVTINGVNYAASMNGMPHGGGSISGNNFNGHHCIHFTNSRTHGSNKVCSLHQAAIKKAMSIKL